MRFKDFQRVMSQARMSRYLIACGGSTKRAQTLYRYNLKLSQEMFTVISCFEVALRNAVDQHYHTTLGNDWLRDAALPTGIFDNPNCQTTAETIENEYSKLGRKYTHAKLVAALGFGFWRHMYAPHQYRAGGQTLIAAFPALPATTPALVYNAATVFAELAKVNKLRNRIAHHEPICFQLKQTVKDTYYARQHYAQLQKLFQWLDINERALLYGLDHVRTICNKIDKL